MITVKLLDNPDIVQLIKRKIFQARVKGEYLEFSYNTICHEKMPGVIKQLTEEEIKFLHAHSNIEDYGYLFSTIAQFLPKEQVDIEALIQRGHNSGISQYEETYIALTSFNLQDKILGNTNEDIIQHNLEQGRLKWDTLTHDQVQEKIRRNLPEFTVESVQFLIECYPSIKETISQWMYRMRFKSPFLPVPFCVEREAFAETLELWLKGEIYSLTAEYSILHPRVREIAMKSKEANKCA